MRAWGKIVSEGTMYSSCYLVWVVPVMALFGLMVVMREFRASWELPYVLGPHP